MNREDILLDRIRKSTVSICQGIGTGFWINSTDLLTCNHVIIQLGSAQLMVSSPYLTGPDLLVPGEIVQVDPTLDIALVRCVDQPVEWENKVIAVLNSECYFDDDLIVRGYPQRDTYGTSERENIFNFTGRIRKGEEGLHYITFANAPLLGGTSGAPLFNRRTGQVCAIAISSIEEGRGKYNLVEGYALSTFNVGEFCQRNGMGYSSAEKNKSLGNHLIYQTTGEVLPTEILHLRAKPNQGFYEDLYVERSIDKTIRTGLQNHQNTLLTGKSLSGKSRALLEALNSIEQEIRVCIFPNSRIIDEHIVAELEDYLTFSTASENNVIIINDIDEYCEFSWFNKFLYQVIESNHHFLMCTCKTIKIKYFKSRFWEFLPFFQTIEIPPIDPATVERLNVLRKKVKMQAEVDDTIGSYFFPLEHMYQRYESISETGREVLRSIKIVDFLYTEQIGSLDIIHNYTNQRFRYYYENEQGKLSLHLFDQTVDQLVESEFITKLSEEKIGVEPVYLRKIINPDLTEKQIVKEVTTFYPEDEEQFCRLILKVEADRLAQEVFEKLYSSGLTKKSYGLGCLISRTDTITEAHRVFRAGLQKFDIQIDEITLNTIISKSANIYEALSSLELFKEFNIDPDDATWYTLIKPIHKLNKDDVAAVYAHFDKYQVQPPIAVYNAIISASQDEETAFQAYCRLGAGDYRLNDFTIHGLLKHVHSWELLWILILDAQRFEITVDERFLQSCYHHIENNEIITRAFTEFLINRGYKIPGYGMMKTLRSIKSIEDCFAFVGGLSDGTYEKRSVIINEILKKSKSIEQSTKVLDFARSQSISVTKNHVNIIFQKIRHASTAQKFFKTYFTKDFTPDSYTYCHLIKVANSFDEGFKYFQKAKEDGLKLSAAIFIEILKKINPEQSMNPSYDQDQLGQVLDEYMHLIGKPPDQHLFWMFMSKCRNWELGLEIYQHLSSVENTRSTIFNSMLKNASDRNKAYQVFQMMREIGLKPTLQNYNLLLKKQDDVTSKWYVYDEIIRLGYQPNMETFSRFLDGINLSKIPEDDLFDVFDEAMKVEAIAHTPHIQEIYNHISFFAEKYFRHIENLYDCIDDYKRMREQGAPVIHNALLEIAKKANYLEEFDSVKKLFQEEAVTVNDDLVISHLKLLADPQKKYELAVTYFHDCGIISARICNYIIRDCKDAEETLRLGINYLTLTKAFPDINLLIRFLRNGVPATTLLTQLITQLFSDDKFPSDLLSLKDGSTIDEAATEINALLIKYI